MKRKGTNRKTWKDSRPAGCTCQEPWEICDACRGVPRVGEESTPAMTSSAFRLVRVVEDSVIPEQVQAFKGRLWSRLSDSGRLTGDAAEDALADMAGGPDPDVVGWDRPGYPTRRL